MNGELGPQRRLHKRGKLGHSLKALSGPCSDSLRSKRSVLPWKEWPKGRAKAISFNLQKTIQKWWNILEAMTCPVTSLGLCRPPLKAGTLETSTIYSHSIAYWIPPWSRSQILLHKAEETRFYPQNTGQTDNTNLDHWLKGAMNTVCIGESLSYG